MPAPLTFEILAAAYFGALALAALLAPVRPAGRAGVALLAAACAVAVIAAALLLPLAARAWLGHAYLAAGYWVPALLVRGAGAAASGDHRAADPPTSFESWLLRTDDRCRRLVVVRPAALLQVLELSYLLCYVVVPAAFLMVWTRGTSADADSYWTPVLLSGFVCYGTLPWLVARPPRAVDGRAPAGVGRVNAYVLDRVSHGLNTFPSGHVAVSLAAALEVWTLRPAAGMALTAIALAIAAGAVAGRYHYAIDVVLGLAIGIAAAII